MVWYNLDASGEWNFRRG